RKAGTAWTSANASSTGRAYAARSSRPTLPSCATTTATRAPASSCAPSPSRLRSKRGSSKDDEDHGATIRQAGSPRRPGNAAYADLRDDPSAAPDARARSLPVRRGGRRRPPGARGGRRASTESRRLLEVRERIVLRSVARGPLQILRPVCPAQVGAPLDPAQHRARETRA